MRIDWWTLALQTINALVLVWLLSRLLFRPVADMIAARKATVARMLDEAEAAKAAARARVDEAERAKADIAAGRAAAMTAAVADAQKQKEALLDAARKEADSLRAEARADMARELEGARDAQMARASALATDIARRLVERLPVAARVAGFIDGLAEAARALPPEAKTGFDHNGGARLTAPRALTAEEAAHCRAALAEAFGRPVDFAVEVDPAILAGLELENAHAAVRNSLREDLARIAVAMERRDENV
jgi:F-type H+-transporting ATPase subunit b